MIFYLANIVTGWCNWFQDLLATISEHEVPKQTLGRAKFFIDLQGEQQYQYSFVETKRKFIIAKLSSGLSSDIYQC